MHWTFLAMHMSLILYFAKFCGVILRFMHDKGNQALVTIDGIDMRCEMRFNKTFYSHEFNGNGLRYEVGVCIATGDIVWISGPFRCGINDLTVSREGGLLGGTLEEGEMVEADCGYEGHPVKHPCCHALSFPFESCLIHSLVFRPC